MGRKNFNTRTILNDNYKKNVVKGTCKKIESSFMKQTAREKQITERWKDKYFKKVEEYETNV